MTVAKVIPGSFSYITDHPIIHPFQIFVAIPKGLLEAAPYLFIVFIAGALFHILQSTGALEALIGVSVRKIGAHRRGAYHYRRYIYLRFLWCGCWL